MADSSNVTASPFLRAEFVDRVLQLTNPAIPYLTAIHLSSAVPTRATAAAAASASASISLYQLILRHCRAQGIKERKQRYELLTAKLHLLVNAPVPPPAAHASANAHAAVSGAGAGAGAGAGGGATNGHAAQIQKAVGELDVLLLRLEIAVLALLHAGGGADADVHANSGSSEAGGHAQAQAHQRATEGVIGAGGKWKEAESVAGLVNTECGHLIRRLERLSTLTGSGTAIPVHERTVDESAQRLTETGRGNGENRAAEDSFSGDDTIRTTVDAAPKQHPQSKWSIVPASDVSPTQAQEHRRIATAIHIRLAALEVLVRVDEQFGRDGRVKRWQEQIAKLQDQSTN